MPSPLTVFKRTFPRVFAYLKGRLLLLNRQSHLVETGLLHTHVAGDYDRSVLRTDEHFDVIVIDGRNRVRCTLPTARTSICYRG